MQRSSDYGEHLLRGILKLKAITIRIEGELFEVVHLVAGEQKASFNDAIRFILKDWWRDKPDRARYEAFLTAEPDPTHDA